MVTGFKTERACSEKQTPPSNRLYLPLYWLLGLLHKYQVSPGGGRGGGGGGRFYNDTAQPPPPLMLPSLWLAGRDASERGEDGGVENEVICGCIDLQVRAID